jgi:hypothetical protein
LQRIRDADLRKLLLRIHPSSFRLHPFDVAGRCGIGVAQLLPSPVAKRFASLPLE